MVDIRRGCQVAEPWCCQVTFFFTVRLIDRSISVPLLYPACSPSDVMTVLRQLQTFLLAQHSRDQTALQGYILRALLGVCQVRVIDVLLLASSAKKDDNTSPPQV